VRLFLYLLLGHLVGDFVLQSSEIVRLKRVSDAGLYPHVAIVTATTAASIWGVVPYPALVVGLVGAIHLLIDRLSVMAFGGKVRQVYIFVADQAVHLAVLVGLAWGIVRLGVSFGKSFLLPIGDQQVALACGTLAVSFAGSIFLFEMSRAFAPASSDEGGALLGYSTARVVGMAERATVYLAAVLGLYPLAGLLVAVRAGWAASRPAGERRAALVEAFSMIVLVSLVAAATVALRPRFGGSV
jgi:hypothetical protein